MDVGSNEDVDCDRLDTEILATPLVVLVLRPIAMLDVEEMPDGGEVSDNTLCEVDVGKRGGTVGWSTVIFLGRFIERAYKILLSAVGHEG